DGRKIGSEWSYSSKRSGSNRRTCPSTLKGFPWNSLVQTIELPSPHSETTLVTGMYCMIVAGFTSACQTFARGALIVTDARPTNVSAIAICTLSQRQAQAGGGRCGNE